MKNWPVVFCGLISLAVVNPALADPTLTVTPIAGINSSLNLYGEGNTSTEIEKIATIQVSTATPNFYGNSFGYTLTLSSAAMSPVSGSGPDVSYQILAVPTGDPQPQSSDFTVPSGSNFTQCATGILNLDVYVKYTPAALQDPGSYIDSIDVDATDNTVSCP